MPKQVSRRSTTYTIPQSFVDDIENAEGWNLIVTMLCEHFKLPDITRRSGLKKVHAHFNEIYKKLNDVYTKNLGNDKIMGGIVGIWAKMSADSILRDRLFKEGLVSKMVPLLDMPSTRHIGLQALSTVTHHGGIASRQEIAKLTPKLVQLINEFSDDAVVMELATVTMAHAIGAVAGQEQEPDHRLLASIDIRSVLKLTVDNLRKPSASHLMINHAVGLLTSVTLHCYKECKAMPPLIQFLTACLRSSDLTTRCNVLGGLTRLNGLEAEPNKQFFDPRKIMDAVSRRFPDNLTDIIMDYGMDRCDTTLTLQSSADFQRAMMKCVQDHDLYALGKMIAKLVVRTEFSITGGAYQTMNEQTGQWEIVNTGLPFTMWGDALPHCARALRQKGTKEDLDDADICELKHHVLQQNIPAAIRTGQEVLHRNPQLAYAHYVIALGADNTQGLKSAKKGLKCKQITPFVRHYLLWRAVEHAGNLGLVVLQQATEGEKDYGEGIAFLVSACEDAKTFISQAPPDNRHMETVLNWYIICSIAIRGPELSNDMRGLGDALEKVALADQFANFLGHPPKKTQMRLTRQLIVQYYQTAAKNWGSVVERFDKMDLSSESFSIPSPSKAEDDLAAWLDDLHFDDDEHEHAQRCAHPKISINSVSLYRCSHCGNPSAVLRKCGGCGKTRYCDQGCQKSHWSEHKHVCKPKTS